MKNLTIVILLALLSSAAWTQVKLPHYEGFNYPTASPLGGQGGWVFNNSGDSIFVSAGNLSYSGFPASSGNMIKFDGAGMDPTKRFDSTATGSVYFSFLVKVTSLGSLNATGGYFAGFYNTVTGTTTGVPVWTRLDGDSFDFGISTRITTPVSWSSLQSLNTTYLIVAAYTFVEGSTNDSAKLWINPPASTFGKTEPAPTLAAVNTTTDLASVMRFMIRQDAATLTPFIEMDELRIGTKWAEVTSAIAATHVAENDGRMAPGEFRLDQNYPNPFNPSTTIRFAIEATSNVSVAISDMLGREITTLVNETLTPGAYSIKWDALSCPSGVYFYTVRSGNASATRRMLLMK
ncbi:MAG: T9SS type A sorting domain-containing protein [bacterium]